MSNILKDIKEDMIDEEIISKNEEKQIDTIPKTYNLLNNFWSLIEKNLPRNKMKFLKHVGEYRSRNITKLETPYPTDYPPWTPQNTKICFEVTGIDEDDFMKDVLAIRGIDGYKDPYLKDKAINIILNLIARYFLLEDDKKAYDVTKYYIGYNYYWEVFTRYFKKYKPKPEIMAYTVNELSFKNSLKVAGSVDKWLYDGVSASFITYNERITRASDWELLYIGEKIKAKFSGYFKSLYRLQEVNEKNKNYIFTSKDIVGENIVENSSISNDITSMAYKFTTKFFESPIIETALKDSIIPGSITERDLRNTILKISDDPDNINDVRSYFTSLFHLFIDEGRRKRREIGTITFYHTMMKMYKPGNTIDPNRIIIKDLLDKWLKVGSDTYRSSKRADTINKFRRSIYEYFILRIVND